MRPIVFAGALIFALSGFVAETSLEAPILVAADSVAVGHKLALNLCSTCHDVSANQEFPPALINPAPSFASIANRPGTTRDGLRKFLATTHGDMASLPLKMPDLMLTEAQKDSAAAYVWSLRTVR